MSRFLGPASNEACIAAERWPRLRQRVRVRRILRHRFVKFGGLGFGAVLVAGVGAALLIAHGSGLEESLPQEAASTLVTVEPARAEQPEPAEPTRIASAPEPEPAEPAPAAASEESLSKTPPELASSSDTPPATASGALAAVTSAAAPETDTETVSALRGTNVSAFAPEAPTAAIEPEAPANGSPAAEAISLPMKVALLPEPAPSPAATGKAPDVAAPPAKQEQQPVKTASAGGKLKNVLRAVTMRSGPAKGAAAIGTISAGTSVEVVRCDSWCEIVHQGRHGFVYKSFLP